MQADPELGIPAALGMIVTVKVHMQELYALQSIALRIGICWWSELCTRPSRGSRKIDSIESVFSKIASSSTHFFLGKDSK